MARNIRINELKSLVKSTINEIKSETVRMHETKMSSKERKKVIDRLVSETVKAVLLEAEIEGDDAETGANFDPSDQKNHPYDRFLANLFGPGLDDAGAQIDLTNAKNVIKQFVKKMVPEEDAGGGQPFGALVTGGDGSAEDKQITLKEDSPAGAASGLKPSQLEVFLPQSIDGYLTRGVDFTKDIMNGAYDSKNSIFFSEDGYIIDGHHRCSSINGLNPACTVKGIMMTAKIETCLKLLNLILEAYENGSAKVASGDAAKSIWNNAPTPESVKATLLEVTQREGNILLTLLGLQKKTTVILRKHFKCLSMLWAIWVTNPLVTLINFVNLSRPNIHNGPNPKVNLENEIRCPSWKTNGPMIPMSQRVKELLSIQNLSKADLKGVNSIMHELTIITNLSILKDGKN